MGRLQLRHHLAHILDRACAGRCDSVGNGGLDFGLAKLRRKEPGDDGDLRFFRLGQLRPVAVAVHFGRIGPLLDHGLHHRQDFVVADAILVAVAARRDIAVLQRSADQTHCRQSGLILGLQRIFH